MLTVWKDTLDTNRKRQTWLRFVYRRATQTPADHCTKWPHRLCLPLGCESEQCTWAELCATASEHSLRVLLWCVQGRPTPASVGLNWELSASGWTAPPLQFLYISLASSGQSRAERGRAGTMTDRAIDKPRSSERKSWCQLSLSLCESSLHSEQIRAQSKWKALLLLTSLSAVHLI